jgi:hypothetical protein
MLRSIVSIGRKQLLKTSRSFSTAVIRNNKTRSTKKSAQNNLFTLKNDARVFTNAYKVYIMRLVIFSNIIWLTNNYFSDAGNF